MIIWPQNAQNTRNRMRISFGHLVYVNRRNVLVVVNLHLGSLQVTLDIDGVFPNSFTDNVSAITTPSCR